MNKDYNKHLIKTTIGFVIIIFILICCAQHKDNNYDNEPCGIDYSYIVDTLNQDYDTVSIDTIYKVDNTGKLYEDIIIK